MNTMHTPTPWSINDPEHRSEDWSVSNDSASVSGCAPIIGGDGKLVAFTVMTGWGDIDVTNRAFIVKAANNHEALMLELDMKEGDLVMLRQAVEAGDPKNELLIRINDMLRNTRELRVKASTP